MFDGIELTHYLLRLFVLAISLSFHEWSHAFAAWYYGDSTAEKMGRLSLNPLVHLDPIGILLPALMAPIGWAKPVPVNPYNLRNMRVAMPLISFAGPFSNWILALVGCLIFRIAQPSFDSGLFLFLQYFISTNFGLMLFNLLPIHPLDGSKVVTLFMDDKLAERFEDKVEKWGLYPLVFLFVAEFMMSTGPILLWLQLWRPLIHPILSLFQVPIWFYY